MLIEIVCYKDWQGALVIGKKRRMWTLSRCLSSVAWKLWNTNKTLAFISEEVQYVFFFVN